MRISDWSSDVCSADLYRIHGLAPGSPVDVNYSVKQYVAEDGAAVRKILEVAVSTGEPFEFQGRILRADGEIRHVKSHGSIEMGRGGRAVAIRSEERRGGKEGVSTCRSRGSPSH